MNFYTVVTSEDRISHYMCPVFLWSSIAPLKFVQRAVRQAHTPTHICLAADKVTEIHSKAK